MEYTTSQVAELAGVSKRTANRIGQGLRLPIRNGWTVWSNDDIQRLKARNTKRGPKPRRPSA